MVMLRLKTFTKIAFALGICGCVYLMYFLASHIESNSRIASSKLIPAHSHLLKNKGYSKIEEELAEQLVVHKHAHNDHDINIGKRMLNDRADQLIKKEFGDYYDSRDDEVNEVTDIQNPLSDADDNEYDVPEENNDHELVRREQRRPALPTTRQHQDKGLDFLQAGHVGPYPDSAVPEGPRCDSWLTHTHHVHDCISGEVVGKVPPSTVTEPLPEPDIKPPMESSKRRQQSFQKVFQDRAWGHDWDPGYKGLNASGMGSTLPWAQDMIASLHSVVNQIKAVTGKAKVTMLDVPCGDMQWMQSFLKTRDDILYTGMDIVPELINSHKKTFGQFTQWQFVQRDVMTTGIGQFDLVLSRMMMQHLYHQDVHRLLYKLSQSGSSYLMMTSFAGNNHNDELKVDEQLNPGRFRGLNLELPPFSLAPPVCLHRDGPIDAFQGWDHFIGLWRLPLSRLPVCSTVYTLSWKRSRHQVCSCVKWTDLMILMT